MAFREEYEYLVKMSSERFIVKAESIAYAFDKIDEVFGPESEDATIEGASLRIYN